MDEFTTELEFEVGFRATVNLRLDRELWGLRRSAVEQSARERQEARHAS